MSTIRYRPEIDGLRALAVVPVILFHIDPAWLPGGFVGVDIFFVISGYLITSIILAELAAGTFTFAGFWERRVRRILPPLFAMMISVMLLYLVIGVPAEATSSLGHQVLRVASFTANHFMKAATGNYWGPVAESMPMLHTWSLAVEEQFYLIFPLVVLGLWRLEKRLRWGGTVGAAILIAGLISLLACVSRSAVDQPAAFYLLPFRAWELAIGAAVAVWHASRKVNLSLGKRAPALANAGFLLMVTSLVVVSGAGFPGWQAALPVAGAALYVAFSSEGGLASKFLSQRPVVYVGKLSYSLYLWHWPALVMGGLLAGLFEQAWLRGASLLFGILLAAASYHFVEPVGRRTQRLVLWTAGSSAVLVALAAFIKLSPPLLRPPVEKPTYFSGIMYESVDVPRQLRERRTARRFDGVTAPTPALVMDGMRPVFTGPPAQAVDLVVLGDSHGMMWSDLLHEVAETRKARVAFAVASGIPPFFEKGRTLRLSEDKRREFNQMRLQLLRESKPRAVVIAARWDSAQAENDITSLDNLVGQVASAAPGARIFIIGQPPMLACGDQNALQWLAWRDKWSLSVDSVKEAESGDWQRARAYLRQYCAGRPDVTLVEVDDIYRLPDGRIRTVQNGAAIYTDDDHLSDYGASLAAERVRAAILPLLSQ